ncbi:MAG: zinc-ribbon domain-containing protein [Thalassovita sp.]
MRLICPNCGAQYEVPDGVVPVQGRDVQCSNCGNTWFQAHPDHDADLAEELGQDVMPETPTPEPEPEPDPEPAEDTAPEDAPKATRRELDPAIADMLREEAEFEARQRAAEAEVDMQTQPDLGLEDPAPDEPSRRAEEARQRMERLKGPQPEPEIEEPEEEDLSEHVGSRRELLPDIEEINSSLNAEARKPAQSDDHAAPGTEGIPAPRKSSGFGGGFILGVLVIALLWSVHVFSGQIAAQVPQLAKPLESYSSGIEKGRDWLDTQVKALLVKLDELAAASEE